MIAVGEQERADHFFRRHQVAVAEQPGRRDHFLRQRLEFRDVGGGGARVVGVAAHPVEAFQHAPARRQCRVDRDRLQECLDRLRRILHRHVAMAALLIQAAVAGMEPLELLERRERVRGPGELALAEREQIEDVAVFGDLAKQSGRGRHALGEAPLLDERADARDLGLHGRGRMGSCCGSHGHPIRKRVGIAAHPPVYRNRTDRPRRRARPASRT